MTDLASFAQKAHALLFSEGGGLTYKRLMKALDCDEGTLNQTLDTLSARLTGTGLALVRSDTEAVLVIAPEAREAVLSIVKEEQEKDIGEAGLEVIAVLLYEGPSTRAHIDYIRGVNSSSTIRTLLTRGLVERSGNPDDGREYLHRPTTALLAHLGVGKKEDLPDYGIISRELAAFTDAQDHGSGESSADGNV